MWLMYHGVVSQMLQLNEETLKMIQKRSHVIGDGETPVIHICKNKDTHGDSIWRDPFVEKRKHCKWLVEFYAPDLEQKIFRNCDNHRGCFFFAILVAHHGFEFWPKSLPFTRNLVTKTPNTRVIPSLPVEVINLQCLVRWNCLESGLTLVTDC